MRDIQMALSASSSSSQQAANNDTNYGSKPTPQKQQQQEQQQQAGGTPSTLINEISTLRSRLRELDKDSIAGRLRSSSIFDSSGQREPPQQDESALVIQLRKELSKMEQEKAEMELTLMNQMSNLAFENQTTIDGLHARLEQAEKSVETFQQEQTSMKPSSFNHLEVQRLRKNLGEERGMRRALEESRDIRNGELDIMRKHREAIENENAAMKQELAQMQQQMDDVHSSNKELTVEVRALKLDKEESSKMMETLRAQVASAHDQQKVLEQRHKSTLSEVEKSHQGQLTELKQSYQQRCNQLEKELANTFDNKQVGLGQLHNKMAAVREEKEHLEVEAAEIREQLEQEKAANQELEQALEEQGQNNDKLWAKFEESERRCTMLEQELAQQFGDNHDRSDLTKENEMLSNQIAAIHAQCVTEQENSSKLKEALDAERSTNTKLRLSLRQHQQRYEEINRNLHKNQSGIGMVNGKVTALERENQTLSTQLATVRDELVKEKVQRQELEASVSEHQKVIEEQMQSTTGRRHSDVAALENAQLELQSVLNSYQSDMARLDRKVKLAEQQLTERNRQNQRLEVEINEERRIRKSLAAQLAQAKNASKQQLVEISVSGSSGGDKPQTACVSQGIETELEMLRKENAKLHDELKKERRRTNQVDPGELEFLRTQNRMLGERANGLHGEQVKELQDLREKAKVLNEEIAELRNSKASTPGRNNSVFVQKDTKSELEQLRKQNAEFQEELNAVKQGMLFAVERGSRHSKQQQRVAQTSGETFATPPRPSSRRASPRGTEPSPSNLHIPHLSPPLVQQTLTSTPGSPRTPVRGIVESFERIISRTNSNASLSSAAEAARSQQQSDARKTSTPQTQGEDSSELDDIRRALNEEKATVQDLRNTLKADFEVIEHLRQELSQLEEADAKRAQLERALVYREQDIVRLEANVTELEDKVMDYGDIQEAMEQYRVTVRDLQNQLQDEAQVAMNLNAEVMTLKVEISKLEGVEKSRDQLQSVLEERVAEVQRLRSRVTELEDMALEVGNASEAMEQERRRARDLQINLDAKSGLVAKLRDTLSSMEETLENERTTCEDFRSQFEAQSEVVTTLREELCRSYEILETEKTKSTELQCQLDADALVSLREELASMKAKADQEKSAFQDLRQALKSESDLVSSLRNELSTMDELEATRATLEKRVLDGEIEIKRLRFQVCELEMLLSNAETLTKEPGMDKLMGELAQADEAKKGYEKKLFDVRAETEILSGQIAKLGDALELSQTESKALKAEVSSYKESNEHLKRQKREDEDLIERLQTELGAARMGLERSLDELEKAQGNGQNAQEQNKADMKLGLEEVERLKLELALAKQAVDINVEEMENLQRCMKNADASRMIAVKQGMSQCQDRQQEIEELKIELAAKEETGRGHDEEVKRLHSQVAALQQELGDAMTYVEELKGMLLNIQSAHDSELKDAQTNKSRASRSIGAEVNTLKVELTKNQISKADMEMEYMKQVHDLEGQIAQINEEREQLLKRKEVELHQLQHHLQRKDDEIRQLEKEREQICSSMNSVSSSRKDEMDGLQEELMTLTAKTASQTREIHSLKMKLEEHDFRKSEFQRLNERIGELEDELRLVPQRRSDVGRSDVEIMKTENKMLRESIRELTIERRNLQEKLEAHLAEKSSSKSTQVLRERNSALKKEVEKLTKRLKKMEHSMTRFTI
jgi:chromosome segregation ATPase